MFRRGHKTSIGTSDDSTRSSGFTLFTGSANFDMLSATLQPEVLAVTNDPALVVEFEARVMRPGLAGSWDWPEARSNVVIGGVWTGIISLAGNVLRIMHVRR